MKPIYKKLILPIMFVSAFSLPVFASDVTVDSLDISSGDIAIIFTNDIHGGISSDFDFSGSSKSLGFAGLMGIKADLQSKTQNVTTIDMGDAIQGTAVCAETNGAAVADLMDSIGYDIRIPGNHEFDFGMDTFLDYAKKVGSFLSCNFKHIEAETVFDSYKVISYDVNGQEYKVGYVGMCTPETVVSSSPSKFQNENGEWLYSFSSDSDELLYETVQASIDAALDEGADLIIGLGHMGDEGVKNEWSSYAIIQNTVGMSAFLDGHAHNIIPERWVEDKEGNPVLLTSTGTKLENVGVMKIHVNENEENTVQITNTLVNTLTEEEMHSDAYLEVQEEVAAVEEKFMYMFIPITTTEFPFYDSDPETNERMIRCREMNIGDLLTDAYRTVLNTDIALVSGGNIRAGLNAGSITYLNLMTVLPWNTNMIALEATGQQILDALEMASRTYPDECAGFFQVSGITYSIDPLVESSVVVDSDGSFAEITGEYRVKDVKIGEENLDPKKTYTVAISAFTALEGGDGMSMFKDCKIVVPVEDGWIDHDIVTQYLQSCDDTTLKGYSDPYGQGRITESGKPSVNKTSDSSEESNAAEQALAKLLSGNEQYLSGSITPDISASLRTDLTTNGQHPYAIVITCSDSRVPAELIFNSSLGDIFVIRTAGNVVSDFEIGSVEYGAEHLGSPLVLVLGHTNCGAVTAATEGGEAGGKIQSIVDEIAPSVQKAKDAGAEDVLSKAIEFNVTNSVNKILSSDIIKELREEGKVEIVGGVYDITTGTISIIE